MAPPPARSTTRSVKPRCCAAPNVASAPRSHWVRARVSEGLSVGGALDNPRAGLPPRAFDASASVACALIDGAATRAPAA